MRIPRWPRRTDDDFANEVQSHIDLEAERLVEEGLSPAEARLAARRRFGSPAAARERFYESRRVLWLDHLWQDLRAAARSVTKYPVACAVAVISLAGGIGATTATLTIREVVFRRAPALYHDPAQLSRVQVGSPDRPITPIGNRVHGLLYAVWRDALPGSTLAASTVARVRDVRTSDRLETVPVRSVTPAFFTVLGVDAALGRTLSDATIGTTGPAPAVLSHRLWEILFDRSADALGATIWIEGRPHVVVGIMPERFWFSTMDSPVWTPLEPGALSSEAGLEVVIRRGPGVTPDALAQQLHAGLVEYTQRLPAAERQLRLKVSGLEGTPLGQSVSLVLPWLLGASVLLTLLIACANVAILVIAQWTAREHEIAIRASLGASRGRIVQALVTESVLIAAIGGLLGIAATLAIRGLIVRNAGASVRFFDLSIDPSILIASAVITLLTGLVSGVGPALLETRRLHGNPMRTMASSDRVRQRWRHALVVMEIAVTVALLVVTATMIDGYRRNFTNDVGYRTRPLLMIRVENSGGVPIARILDVLKQMPGVAAAEASTTVPYLAFGPAQRVSADRAGSQAVRAEKGTIGSEFFATLDVPLRAGRGFTAQDSAAMRTAMVNETLARQLFANHDPVGRQLWMADTAYEIVGVVADYKNTTFQARDWNPKVYVPLSLGRTDAKRMEFLIRAKNDPTAVVLALRRQIRDAAPGNVVAAAVTLDQIIAISGQEILVGTAPLAPLIATGMLLTAAGIYGVLAFAIARRSKELAVRVAIGASGRDVVRLVTAHSLRLVALGTFCGVGATFALTRVVRASGGGGSFFDPDWPAFLVPVLIILAIGVVATWIPSRRALRINPAMLLRTT
jgi:putative ABC transport system permease protein